MTPAVLLATKVATTVGVFVLALKRHRENHIKFRNSQQAAQGSSRNSKDGATGESAHASGGGGGGGGGGEPVCHTPPILAGPRPCMGDLSLTETIINLVTCVPYFHMARSVPQVGKCIWNRLFSISCSFTGVCAVLYHLSTGPIRNFFRRLDYTAVALSSVSLTVARSHPSKPLFLGAISTVLSPFQPLVVAAFHVFGTEFAFFRRALEDPKLRDTHCVHTLSGVLGFMAFYADDWFPQVPYLHAAWHLLSAYATSLTPCLIVTKPQAA